MTPTAVLEKLLNLDKHTARYILAGLAVIAAAAIAVSWIGRNPEAIWLAVYVLVFAFLATILAFIINNPKTRMVLGWSIVSVFVIFLAGLVDSALALSGRLPTPACYVRMLWEHPSACEQRVNPTIEVAARQAANPQTTWHYASLRAAGRLWTVQGTGTASQRYTDGPIYLHFGTGLERTQMVLLARELTRAGWPIQDAGNGGEAVRNAPDANEVRFFDPSSRSAAIELARAVKEAKPGADIVVRDFSRSGRVAQQGLLEIWLSR